MKRLIVCVAVGLCVLTVGSGVAAAKSNPRATAQAAAEAVIAGFLPRGGEGGGGEAGACDVQTQSGFFAKNKSYLASCSTIDGTFQLFVITNADGGSVNVKSQYMGAQLAMRCAAGGSAFSAGVRGKVIEVFAGSGAGVTVARGLRDLLAQQIKNTPGHVSTDLPC